MTQNIYDTPAFFAIFMAPRNPGWLVDDQGRNCWPVDGYQLEGPRVTK
jgi:hypothetical protein